MIFEHRRTHGQHLRRHLVVLGKLTMAFVFVLIATFSSSIFKSQSLAETSGADSRGRFNCIGLTMPPVNLIKYSYLSILFQIVRKIMLQLTS